jgi:acyl-CoA dehydrogenase
MSSLSHLDWPFFEPRHREFAAGLDSWAASKLDFSEEPNLEKTCRKLARQLSEGGWFRCAIAGESYGAVADSIDVRTICLMREGLAQRSGLAEFVFAMQGLGSGPISLFGSDAQKKKYLPRVADGSLLAAFALSETDAGSDAAALRCEAKLDGDTYVLNGEKTWISNGGIADFYVVFVRTGEAPGSRGISAFVVEASTPGFEVVERIEVVAPHPLARLAFNNCRVSASQQIGEPGQGLKIALATLDVFRTSVAAAATGFARRALRLALERSVSRQMFGQALADFQLTQAKLADMASAIDAAALLTYRAAWLKDAGKPITTEAAMAKMVATESAQRVIDSAVQIFGALGVMKGNPVESLYREIRPLRIYEGATEVQQIVIARGIIKALEAERDAPPREK